MVFPSTFRTQIDRLSPARPVNDEALGEAEKAHREAIHDELRATESRLLIRLARGVMSVDVWAPTASVPARRSLFELLAGQPRLLLVGGRASGKTALVSLLAAQAAWRDLGFGEGVPIMVAGGGLEAPHLDEVELGRLNPALGLAGVRHALQTGRGLLIVDGLDEAESPDALKASIGALAAAYPSSRFVVTTRPLPAKIAGKSETLLAGFLSVRVAAPAASPVASIEDLDEQRVPARWAERIADDVSLLLEAWAPGRVPSGSMLARLTSRGRLLLASHIALEMHDGRGIEYVEAELARRLREELENARWFPDTEQILHADEQPHGGEALEDLEAIAQGLIEDIRRHPGVLVETRPGVFGFASLAVQQYLTAIFFASERDAQYCVEMRGDPWWHGVLVLAASLGAPWSSALPASALLRALLEASASSDSATTFLAARCAEVARYVPPALRAQIEERLHAVVPPRSSLQMIHIVDDIGDIAAPALLDALRAAGPNERAFTATALGRLHHPPALRVVARLVQDEELTTESILCWLWKVDVAVRDLPVGFFAFAAYFNLALANPAAYRLFGDVLRRASGTTLQAFLDLVGRKLLDDVRWGVPEEPERDPDRVTDLLEKVVAAAGWSGR